MAISNRSCLRTAPNVNKGDVLFIIRQEPFQVALNAAQAELERTQAELELAQSEFRHIEPLVPQQAVTQAELDKQAALVKTSAANVAFAETAVRRTRSILAIQKSVLRSAAVLAGT